MPRPAKSPPRICPGCGIELPEFPYAQIKPAKTARAVRRVALWLIPILAVVYLGQLFLGSSSLGFGTGAGYYAVLWTCGPSLLLYLVSRLLPRVRQVICLRCSWNAEYPLTRAVGRVG